MGEAKPCISGWWQLRIGGPGTGIAIAVSGSCFKKDRIKESVDSLSANLECCNGFCVVVCDKER
jgi:hypothetical protein